MIAIVCREKLKGTPFKWGVDECIFSIQETMEDALEWVKVNFEVFEGGFELYDLTPRNEKIIIKTVVEVEACS